jgi:hypothetical protein
MIRRTCIALIAFALATLAGCAGISPPQPWERGLLAKPEMAAEGDPLQQRFDAHIFMSKENASGGTGAQGGGCGCN